MGFLRFLRQYFLPVVLAISAFCCAVLDSLSRFQQIQTFGIPSYAWTPISGLLFLMAAIIFFYQVHRHVEAAGGILQPVPRRRKPKVRPEDELRGLGREALEFAADIRNFLGPAYKYGLGVGMDPIPVEFRPRLSLIMERLMREGFSVPRYVQNVDENIQFEHFMRYFEFVGQYIVRDPTNARAVAAKATEDLSKSLQDFSRRAPPF